MTTVPMIGMQEAVTFKLVSPKKGKLQMNQIYSAYTKSTLSSIPRNVEVVLIKDNKVNSSILQNYPSKISVRLPTNHFKKPKALKKMKKESSMPNYLCLSNNSNGNSNSRSEADGFGFGSNSNRFDTKKTLYDKYSPGPGEYNDQLLSQIKLRYKSLYVNTRPHPLKRKIYNSRGQDQGQGETTTPGPGFYNTSIGIGISTLSSPRSFNKTMLCYQFISKKDRFKDNSDKYKLGPGYYNEYKESKWNSKQPSFFFKKISMKHASSSPENKYIDNDKQVLIILNSNQQKDIEVNDNKVNNTPKRINNYKKIYKLHKLNKHLSSPLFNLNDDNNGTTVISPQMKELNAVLCNEKLVQSNTLMLRQSKSNLYTILKNNWSKNISAPFVSTSKRSTIFDVGTNHNPGPCYYYNKYAKID